jgi:hypothetical protein
MFFGGDTIKHLDVDGTLTCNVISRENCRSCRCAEGYRHLHLLGGCWPSSKGCLGSAGRC